MIDTHCHLNFNVYDGDRTDVINNAKKAGISRIITPGVNYESNLRSLSLADDQPDFIYPAIGFHPYESKDNPEVRTLKKMISKKVIAIGECGLDYHLYSDEPAAGKKEVQKILFMEQAALAIHYDLPLIIHCRNAFPDLFTALDGLPKMPRGVVHCFSGGLQDARMAIERGLFIGIDGNITFSKHLQQILPVIPVDRLLLETDSPYLTPIPHRGKRNEPKYLIHSAKFIAGLYEKTVETISELTDSNAFRLFHFA
jgi:TatD DNase family protein